VVIIAYGRVAAQGSKKHVGHGSMVETSKYLPSWREAVKTAAIVAMENNNWNKILGPVSVMVTFTMPKPKSAPKRIRTFPDKAPDLDKCCRSVFDSLTQAGVWEDDARVVHCIAAKVFPGEGLNSLHTPGVHIEILPWDGLPA